MSIATLVPDHLFTTRSDNYGGRITNISECSCGKPLTWARRDEEHLRHVLDVVWREGYERGIDDTRTADAVQVGVGLGPALYAQPNRTSPYKEYQ